MDDPKDVSSFKNRIHCLSYNFLPINIRLHVNECCKVCSVDGGSLKKLSFVFGGMLDGFMEEWSGGLNNYIKPV